MKIKITKINKQENAPYRTPEKEEYVCGEEQEETVSLFIGYEAIGETEELPTEGKTFSMMRTERNGVKCLGFFQTSIIEKVEGDKFYTANSVYKWEIIIEG